MRLASMLTFWTAHSSFFKFWLISIPSLVCLQSSDSIRAAMDIFLCRLSKTKNLHQIWRWQFNSCFWSSVQASHNMISYLYFFAFLVLFHPLIFVCLQLLWCFNTFFGPFFDCIRHFVLSLQWIAEHRSWKVAPTITTTLSDRSYVCFIFNFLAEIGVKISRKEYQRYFLGVTELRCLNTCIGQLQWSEENVKALTMENGDRASQQGHHKKIVE